MSRSRHTSYLLFPTALYEGMARQLCRRQRRHGRKKAGGAGPQRQQLEASLPPAIGTRPPHCHIAKLASEEALIKYLLPMGSKATSCTESS
mmetsp:Transcript_78443/g.175859  ORF Transcript_78443/g.175859 Transcript_78443/m.175859 type:complete len:91 (+) Transcript_78443:14-286(+)